MTTISQERSKLAAVKGAPTLRRREQWGARFNYGSGRYTVTEPATRIFIHITVTNPGNYRGNDAHAQAVENIGISRFPNTGISYNRGCMLNAALYEFQPIGRQGAHTVNDFRRSTCSTSGCPGKGKPITAPSWNLNVNARAYVICQNVGNTVSDAQVDALARAIVADYRAGFITYEAAHHPHGHRCVSSKSCPGDRMWAKMPALHDRIHHYLDNGLPGGTTPPQEDDMSAAAEKQIAEIHTRLFNTNQVDRPNPKDYPNDPKTSAKYSWARSWYWAWKNRGTVKVKPNAWGADRWPGIPDDGYSRDALRRAGYQHGRAANENTEKILEGQAQQAARLAAVENVLQQLLDKPGQPIDMERVAEAARVGAQESLSALDVRIEINPAQEPTGAEDNDASTEP